MTKHKGRLGYNILHLAAYYCSYEMAEYLVDEIGIDKKVKTDLGETALDIAKSTLYECKTYAEDWKAFRKLLHPKSRG